MLKGQNVKDWVALLYFLILGEDAVEDSGIVLLQKVVGWDMARTDC